MSENNMVNIEIDIEKETLYKLMLMAHEQDITLNQLVNNILRKQIAKFEAENDG